MHQESWAKGALFAIAAIGFVIILGVALSSGHGFEGKDWVVDELAIDGTMTPPIAGTELTARFDDGSVGGNAGCNAFFAEYTTDGNSMSIGPAGSTLAFCDMPEGIMDQEFAYLALLGTTDSYSRDGDRLTLSSDGNPVITFSTDD